VKARATYSDNEAHAKVHGGGIELKHEGRVVSRYQSSAENS
jgi:hypothetical protein